MNFTNWKKPFKFKAEVPKLDSYIGRYVRIPGEHQPVKIETICGNVGLSMGREKPRPQFYEINGKFLIGMLRFHAQMTGDKSITEQQFKDFEDTEFEAEKLADKKLLNDVPKYEDCNK